MKKFGFTLAEVLITLGIIGVVAAMTMPSLITNYKVRVLKAQFEKADYTITQAMIKACNEVGCNTPADFYVPASNKPENNTDKNNQMKASMEMLNTVWLKQFPVIEPINTNLMIHRNIRAYDMFGKDIGRYEQTFIGGLQPYFLANGMMITPFFSDDNRNSAYGILVMIDTNGPYKGPNRLGHDVFRYSSTMGISTYSDLCNPGYTHSSNQRGCYIWAHLNLNPKTHIKGDYWSILYKQQAYWEKDNLMKITP